MAHEAHPNPNKTDDPRALPLLTVGLSSVFLIVASVYALIGLYYGAHTEAAQKANAGETQKVAQLAADQDARLNTPGWVDRVAGVVRIPIDDAIKLVAEELPQSKDGTGPWSPRPGAVDAAATESAPAAEQSNESGQ